MLITVYNVARINKTEDNQMIKSQNEAWGFYGQMDRRAEKAWPITMVKISGRTGFSEEQVRVFLDSKFGRHLADLVLENTVKLSLVKAIDAAIIKYDSWKVFPGMYNCNRHVISRSDRYLCACIKIAVYCEE